MSAHGCSTHGVCPVSNPSVRDARAACLQAIRIDETVADSATSSMVDDSFFVLLKAGRRSMGTGKAPSVVAILNQINSTLSSLYRNALAAKLAGASGRLVGAAPAELGEPPGPAAAASAAAFNNAEVRAGGRGVVVGGLPWAGVGSTATCCGPPLLPCAHGCCASLPTASLRIVRV